MASFNRVILVGNLTRDPQVKYLQNGTAVAELGLAVNRTWFDKARNEKKEEVAFIDVTYFGKNAENAGQYLTKGNSCLCEWYLKLDSWEDRESGQKRSKLKVMGETLQFLGSKGGSGQRAERGEESQEDSGYNRPYSKPNSEPQPQWRDTDAPADEVPF